MRNRPPPLNDLEHPVPRHLVPHNRSTFLHREVCHLNHPPESHRTPYPPMSHHRGSATRGMKKPPKKLFGKKFEWKMWTQNHHKFTYIGNKYPIENKNKVCSILIKASHHVIINMSVRY